MEPTSVDAVKTRKRMDSREFRPVGEMRVGAY